MLLLLDRVEYECCNRFAGQSETQLGGGALPTAVSRVFFLGETWRPGDRPVEAAGLHDLLHGKRIAHVVSHDETGDPIGNTGRVRRRRKNEQPLYAGTLHRP